MQDKFVNVNFDRARRFRSELTATSLHPFSKRSCRQGSRAHLPAHTGSLVAARFHTHPRRPASLKGFSSLAYSPRAAATRCFMRTGSPESAAKKAARGEYAKLEKPL